jgi:hypothetical protein
VTIQQLLTITLHCKTKFEDTKEVIKIYKSYKNNQCNEEKKKNNKANNGGSNTAQTTLNNTNSTKKRGQTKLLWKDNHFLIDSQTKFEDTKEVFRSHKSK